MKLSLSHDTLAYQLGVRPALRNRDMSKAPLQGLVKAISDFQNLDNAYDWLEVTGKNEKPMGDPHKDAIITYMLQDAVFQIQKRVDPLEPLGKYLPVLELYHEQTALRATRIFYYLVLICARESRHSNTDSHDVEQKDLRSKWGDSVVDFHQKLRKLNESLAVEKFLTEAPSVPVKLWLGFMAEHFRKHSYGHAFGGKKWAAIADVAYEFATGAKPAQLMLDVSFALAHNTAPIFNKGMLYHNSTTELIRILDVQRSGQVPQLVADGDCKTAKSGDVLLVFNSIKQAIPEFGQPGYVDWYKVEELGSVHKYPGEKKEQLASHGLPGTSKLSQMVESAKAAVAAKEAVEEALAMVQIFPGQFIKKIKRVKV